tara:strand:- start:3009 stop:3509 length:501 start_codon:yes stop_codon:yes gene_type:complete
MSNNKILVFGLLFTIGLVAVLFWPASEAKEDYSIVSSPTSDKIEVVMYKNEGCQCCTKWADLMNEDQYAVIEKPIPNLMEVKREKGVPPRLESCHTAMVGNYFVEGHVPIEDVNRLLEEKPEGAIGLTAPGMPMGSPGMEVPGRPADNYDVYLVKKDGTTEVFASH